jgi:hypothetical protein
MYKTWIVVAGSNHARIRPIDQEELADHQAQAEMELRSELREALREHPSIESQLAAYGAMLLLDGDDETFDFSADDTDVGQDHAEDYRWGRVKRG